MVYNLDSFTHWVYCDRNAMDIPWDSESAMKKNWQVGPSRTGSTSIKNTAFRLRIERGYPQNPSKSNEYPRVYDVYNLLLPMNMVFSQKNDLKTTRMCPICSPAAPTAPCSLPSSRRMIKGDAPGHGLVHVSTQSINQYIYILVYIYICMIIYVV